MSAVLKGSAIYVLGNLIHASVNVLLLPLYARFMSPSEFGILGLNITLASVLGIIMSFGAPGVVARFFYRFDGPEERRRFLSSYWWWVVAFDAALSMILLLAGRSLFGSLFTQLPFSPYGELAIAFSFFNAAFVVVLLAIFRVQENPKGYVLLTLAQSALIAALTVWLVVGRGEGVLGAVLARTLATGLVGLFAALLLVRKLGFSWEIDSIRSSLAFGLPLVPHEAGHWALSTSDRAILDRHVSLSSIGIYSLAYRVGSVVGVVFQSIAMAISPVYSRAAASGEILGQIPSLATYYAVAVGWIGVSAIAIGDDLVRLVFPDAYASSTGLLPWVIVGMMAAATYYIPLQALILLAGKSKLLPIATLISGGANIGLNLLFVPRFGTQAAAINTTVGYVLLAVIVGVFAQRAFPVKYEVRRLMTVLALSVVIATLSLITREGSITRGLLTDGSAALAFPILLFGMGFWSRAERDRLRRLFPTGAR